MGTTKKIIVGLTGPLGGGKGTVAEIFKDSGFFCTSLSDRIREEIKKYGGAITRENLQEAADKLRKKFGSPILAQRSWDKISRQSKNGLIESIRSIGEVNYLKNKANFILIGVTASRRLRYQRIKTRAREGDPIIWEEFIRLDRKDFQSGSHNQGRDIKACLAKVDYLIINDGSLQQLKRKTKLILKQIS